MALTTKAVTFDLWNTLLCDGDFSGIRVDLLASVLADRGFPRSLKLVRAEYTSAANRIPEAWRKEHRNIPVCESVGFILERLKVTLPDETKRAIVLGFEEAILHDQPPLVDGVKIVLERLSRRYRLGLISDTGMTPGRTIREVLKNYDVLRYLSHTVFSDEVGHTKPHPLMFRRAVEGLGVEANETIHVGDLLRTDVSGAKAAGMKTVWFDRNDHRSEDEDEVVPDHIITNLLDLLPLLETRD